MISLSTFYGGPEVISQKIVGETILVNVYIEGLDEQQMITEAKEVALEYLSRDDIEIVGVTDLPKGIFLKHSIVTFRSKDE